MDKSKIQQFLSAISQIESSGGKNLNHETISGGMHKGTRAIGKYGLMPLTVKDIINRQRMDHSITPEIAALRNMDRDALQEQFIQQPELEENLANYLANYVLDRQQGNESAAAYSWFMGHNTKPEKITSQKLLNSDYVGKYNKFKSDAAIDKLNEEEMMKVEIQKRALALLANK